MRLSAARAARSLLRGPGLRPHLGLRLCQQPVLGRPPGRWREGGAAPVYTRPAGLSASKECRAACGIPHRSSGPGPTTSPYKEGTARTIPARTHTQDAAGRPDLDILRAGYPPVVSYLSRPEPASVGGCQETTASCVTLCDRCCPPLYAPDPPFCRLVDTGCLRYRRPGRPRTTWPPFGQCEQHNSTFALLGEREFD
jgi:hypothetical protein